MSKNNFNILGVCSKIDTYPLRTLQKERRLSLFSSECGFREQTCPRQPNPTATETRPVDVPAVITAGPQFSKQSNTRILLAIARQCLPKNKTFSCFWMTFPQPHFSTITGSCRVPLTNNVLPENMADCRPLSKNAL